ncbi:MAG: zinc metallopeptidase [Mycoplasmatales bacterium]
MLDFVAQNSLLVFVIILILPLMASINVNSTFKRFSKIPVQSQMTGAEVARFILQSEGITNVQVLQTGGKLSDNYNPANRTVNLSSDIYNGRSVAATCIAAHEVGHAIQHHKAYAGLALRTATYGLVRITSPFLGFTLLIGIWSQISGLIYLGIIALIAILFFQIATLPVEFDASKRALAKIKNLNLVTTSEYSGAQSVLNAAAMTYVTAVVVTLLNILRLFAMTRD